MKKILVTAGSTSVPIDRVRVISNLFHGRTGHHIAEYAAKAGNQVTLLTSSAEKEFAHEVPNMRVRRFRFFDDLRALMQEEIQSGAYDAIIHSAAVSDYRVAAVYTENEKMIAHSEEQNKIGSNHPSLTIKLVPTEKLIDLIREPWGFSGTLVKFKLQVGLTDEELLKIAERSLRVSAANLIVANCLEWAHEYAYVLDAKGGCERVTRFDLPNALLRRFK